MRTDFAKARELEATKTLHGRAPVTVPEAEKRKKLRTWAAELNFDLGE